MNFPSVLSTITEVKVYPQTQVQVVLMSPAKEEPLLPYTLLCEQKILCLKKLRMVENFQNSSHI
jgi:hypothetical protein